jgi:hypothetical protein
VDDYGNINSTIDNFWNLTNTLVHEIDHQKKWSERTAPIDHVEANLTQANHESWKMTTQEYKSSTLSYSAYLLNQALIQGEPLENVIKKMDKVNNSPIGNNGFLFYNSETNQIEAIHLISTFEVTPEKE